MLDQTQLPRTDLNEVHKCTGISVLMASNLNHFRILAFIPLFEYVVYPVFAKFGMLTKPLQRIVTGGTLAGVSFVVSGTLYSIIFISIFSGGVRIMNKTVNVETNKHFLTRVRFTIIFSPKDFLSWRYKNIIQRYQIVVRLI